MDDEEITIVGQSDDDALERIGMLIDKSDDERSVRGTTRAFALLDELAQRDLAPKLAALTHYFRANAWAGKEHARTDGNVWSWEQTEVQEQILELRRAIRHEGFTHLDALRQCQIFTNLANQLNKIGRCIDAVEIWDRALKLNEKFAMAKGNRGIALSHYARALYDRGHARLMLMAAHDALTSASAGDAIYESVGYKEARSTFLAKAQSIASHVNVGAVPKEIADEHHGLGRSKEERNYRAWCLANRLFINPLNDLGTLPIAARDVLTLPSIRESSPSARVPEVFGFFNQMKQEFVSARYLYYDGTNAKGLHFSDRQVLLYNTLDYPAYSLSTEKIRAAFRLAYSLFDKISFFLNEYLALGHSVRQVSFRSVWYESKGSSPRPLLKQFETCPNWTLRGLFWLSKDLFEDDFQNVTEPDAGSLNDIRNYLEHKYLQIHQMSAPADPDRHGYSISENEFESKTLRLLKLVRAALTYLSLSVHSEERRRHKDDDGKIIAQMPLDIWEDEWKQ